MSGYVITFKRAEFDIMFGEGISRSGEIIDLGVEHGIIQKSGSWFSYNGSKLAQGRDQAKRVVADNPELAAELEAKIMEALKGASAAPAKADKTDKTPKADKKAPSADSADMGGELDLDTLPDDFSIEEDI